MLRSDGDTANHVCTFVFLSL